jgi:hypothetical protein
VRRGDAGSGNARADPRDRAHDRDERPRHRTRQEEPFGNRATTVITSREVITMSMVFLIFGLVLYWAVTDRLAVARSAAPAMARAAAPTMITLHS